MPEGDRGGPQWRLDTLARMARAGTITGAMRRAGERFHGDFRRAALDQLRALDLARPPVLVNTSNRAWAVGRGSETARKQVFLAIEIVGGMHSLGGSCAWHVLGCELTPVEWVLSRAWHGPRIHPRYAPGILLLDLDLLRQYYQIA